MRRLLILVCSQPARSPLSAAPSAGAEAGALDRTFGDDGIVTAFPHGAVATAVGIDADRRITAVGYTVDAQADVVAVRYRPDGTLDPTFGTNGRARFDLGGIDDAFDVAVTPAGGLAIAGRRTKGEDRMFVLRVRPGGHAATVVRQAWPRARRLRQAPAGRRRGRLHAAGPDRDRRLHVQRRVRPIRVRTPLGTGTLDRGFAGDGRASFEIGTGSEQINDLSVLPGGGILAAGVAENAQDPKFSLVKLTGSGRLDTTFGVGDDGVLDVRRRSGARRGERADDRGRRRPAAGRFDREPGGLGGRRHPAQRRRRPHVRRSGARRAASGPRVRGGHRHRGVASARARGRADPRHRRRHRRRAPEGRVAPSTRRSAATASCGSMSPARPTRPRPRPCRPTASSWSPVRPGAAACPTVRGGAPADEVTDGGRRADAPRVDLGVSFLAGCRGCLNGHSTHAGT